MATIKVKRSDLDKFRPIENLGWKLLEVIEISDPKMAKTGQSMNHFVKMRILAPNDSDKGLEVDHCCNSNGGFAVIPFVAAANGLTVDAMFNGQEETDLELDSTLTKLVEADMCHRTDENNVVKNDFKGWAPAGTHFLDALG